MIELLGVLVLLLSQDVLTVEDVIARVGSVARDPGAPMPIEIRPKPGIRAASLARYADSGMPYLLTIEPERTARPTIAALRLAFGDYSLARRDRGRPVEILFHPPIAGQRWKVVIIAELAGDGRDLEGGTAGSVALRRDPLVGGNPTPAQDEEGI